MPTRLLTALASLMLLCCGPQNAVEDTGGVAADDAAARDEMKGSGGSSKVAPIAMQVRESVVQPAQFASSFSIGTNYDLFYAFDLPSTKSGGHTARFEFYTPSNAVYAVVDVPFAAGTAAAGAQVQADVITGGYRVWTSMPLAGTMIQQMALTGKWTVKVFLDGARVASSVYTLTP